MIAQTAPSRARTKRIGWRRKPAIGVDLIVIVPVKMNPMRLQTKGTGELKDVFEFDKRAAALKGALAVAASSSGRLRARSSASRGL
jgi:hypothetical protein